MRMKCLRSPVAVSVFLLITAYTATTTIIYGDIDVGDANDGSNLADTYNYLRDGLSSAESGDEIRVAPAVCRYEVIDLGTLPGGTASSAACSINDSGQIVGGSLNSLGNYRATLFDESGGGNNIDLGTLAGSTSYAYSINDSGQIVGRSHNSYDRATLFDPTGEGSNIDLGIMGRENSIANSINNNGRIVGWGNNSSGNSCAVLFDPSGAGNNIDLGTLGGRYASARAINNHGQIVGWSSLISGSGRATLFDISGNGNNINLGLLAGSFYGEAYSINDSGQIVGYCGDLSEHYFATLFDSSGSGNNIYLGSLGGSSSRAQSINNSGQIVGWAENSLGQRRACLFDPTGVGNNIDLNTLIAADSGWTLEYAMSINNHGWIVGNGTNPDGFGHAYLLKIAEPKTYYVDADATGANNGSSWADAYYSLQSAFAVAEFGDEIRVAEGIYKPIAYMPPPPPPPLGSNNIEESVEPAVDRTATFQLISGVVIRGGYAGFGEPNADARDIEVYETILSGDLNGDDVEVNDPCDLLTEPSRAENSYHVVTGSDCNESAVLDGFTITAGNANSEGYPFHHGSGGGIQIRFGSMEDEGPVLTNCTFIGNSARSGGGLDNDHCSTTLTNCTFIENFANWGGGIGNAGFPVPKLVNCTFTANYAGYKGGAIANAESRSTLENCTLIANHAELGGAIYNGEASAMLTNCTLIGNSAKRGGAVHNNDGSVRMTNCIVSENSCTEKGGVVYLGSDDGATLTNCILTANSAEKGGVLYVGNDSYARLKNCTVTGNWATDNGGALYVDGPDDAIITNCILWSDTPQEIYPDNEMVLIYSDVEGGWPGQGNIDADPCFVEPGYRDANGLWIDGDYHLLQTSACINAGDNNSLPADIQDLDGDSNTTEQIPYDLDGNPRIVYDVVDMGAFEFENTPPIADAGPNQIVECACNTEKGTKVTLDGTNSSDPDYGVLTYTWTGPFLGSPVEGAVPTVTLEDGCPGEYVITLVVNDGIDDSEPDEVVIKVVDTTTPQFELSVSPTMLWPPDHKMYEITPSWKVCDECDESPDVSLVSIVANEGDNTIGDGHTSNDIQIGDDGSIFVRSERSGTSTGRIYTITYQAVDDSGNATIRSAIVSIPHEFKLLARMGDRWLWRNHTGNLPEDLNGDGIVNLKDIAIFANNWIK